MVWEMREKESFGIITRKRCCIDRRTKGNGKLTRELYQLGVIREENKSMW